ncbi:hypothetical protein TB2_045509 [Malus domestica]
MFKWSGCELLVKVVAQALPSDPDSRKIHWKSWDKLCNAKPEGGMGFRNLYAFNLAVLAKQGWRIAQFPDSLTARLLKAKYFPNTSFWDASVSSSSSYCWSSILKAIVVLEKGTRWLIGDRALVQVSKDRCVPRPSTFRPITLPPSSQEELRVCELIDVDRKMWNDTVLNELFEEEDMELIRALPLSFWLPPIS